MPVGMNSAQAVVMGEKIYIGGGVTENEDDARIFQYDPPRDEWSRLPPRPRQVKFFAMAQFMGHLITVGGGIPDGGGVTGKVYRFKGQGQSQKWEEFLKPMPTARFWLSVATTQSAMLPVRLSLVSGMTSLYSVTLWRCTAVKPLSGTMLTHYLYLVRPCLLSPLQTPGTNWEELVLMTKT